MALEIVSSEVVEKEGGLEVEVEGLGRFVIVEVNHREAKGKPCALHLPSVEQALIKAHASGEHRSFFAQLETQGKPKKSQEQRARPAEGSSWTFEIQAHYQPELSCSGEGTGCKIKINIPS